MAKRLPPGTITEEAYRKRLDYKMDRISYFIAMHGPSNKKTLERRLKIDKPTIYKAVDRLVRDKRIVIHHRAMSGLVKYYDLTRLGLSHLVLHLFYDLAREDAEGIGNVVKRFFVRYPEWLPELAALWPAIEEVGRQERDEDRFGSTNSLEVLALYSVESFCEDEVVKDVSVRTRREKHGIDESYRLDDQVERNKALSRVLLSYLDSAEEDYYIRWFRAVQGNPVLREAATRALQERREAATRALQERIQGFEEMINALAGGGSPPRITPMLILSALRTDGS
jgi:DNA-binding MarR family transcriptional regulator